MDEGLFKYLERVEAMVFFSGYCLVYVVAGYLLAIKKGRVDNLFNLLTRSYALIATLFFGYAIKKFFQQYSQNGSVELYQPLLFLIGVFATLFWLPFFNRRPYLSLVHSLIFFSFIAWDVFKFISGSIEKNELRNAMNILTLSVIFNVSTLFLLFIKSSLVLYFRRDRSNS